MGLRIRWVLTHVRRWYINSKQALTVQMVSICICSDTSTILEPNLRWLMSSGVNVAGSFGSMRLLFVCDMMFMQTIRTVSVAFAGRQLSSLQHSFGSEGRAHHGEHHQPIVWFKLLD